MSEPLRVLIVEDSEDDAKLLVRELQQGGYDPTYERVDTAKAMHVALDRQVWDIVFGDYTMPQFSGMTALKILRDRGFDVPYIFVSATIGEDNAVAAMKAGANDYIMKGQLKRLIPAVQRELRDAKLRQEHRQAEELIRYQAYYDPLTGLPNRFQIRELLQQTIETGQHGKKALALLLMDLDRFREINDTLGHQRGDLLLQRLSKRLREVLWESDIVGRLGGDEFAIILPLAEPAHATVVATKIFKALEPPFVIENLPIAVEASIGIALSPDHGRDADVLIQRADVAMYLAKHSGSGYVIYNAEYDPHNPRRIALMGELRQAIENGQLFLHYQPKVDLRANRVMGVEALVRWQHPEHGLVPPVQFIMSAEKTGLIKPLTLWVFNTAQRQQREWQKAGIDLSVSINLSARNLHDPQLPNQLEELLKMGGGKSTRLELEITESAIMIDPARVLETIMRLRVLGIRFAVDDFGTGYSSLAYLSKLPVDTIKIDRSFVIHMNKNGNESVIVHSTIGLAHNLGLKVTAEGVENQETWDRLVALGCDAAQGYYISRPIPADEFSRWLKESSWRLVGPMDH